MLKAFYISCTNADIRIFFVYFLQAKKDPEESEENTTTALIMVKDPEKVEEKQETKDPSYWSGQFVIIVYN